MENLRYYGEDRRYSTAMKPGLGLGLFFCLFLFTLVVASVIMQLVIGKWGDSTSALRIVTIIQDLLVFILPPIVTALLMTRLPAEFLEVMRKPRLLSVLAVVAAMLVAIPAMNVVIAWNASIDLPETMSWFKTAEANAQAMIAKLMGEPTIGNLIMSVLIVGCLTGFAEELFFRGGLQKLLMCTRMNPHVAIWLAATIFSLFHLQIYGFVPRLLLGAFFGYLMWWSGSLWLPVIAHALNNTLVVITDWLSKSNGSVPDIDSLGVGVSAGAVAVALVSAVLAAVAVCVVRRVSLKS